LAEGAERAGGRPGTLASAGSGVLGRVRFGHARRNPAPPPEGPLRHQGTARRTSTGRVASPQACDSLPKAGPRRSRWTYIRLPVLDRVEGIFSGQLAGA